MKVRRESVVKSILFTIYVNYWIMSPLELKSIKQAAGCIQNLDSLVPVKKSVFDREYQLEDFVERRRIIGNFLLKKKNHTISLRLCKINFAKFSLKLLKLSF